VKRTVNGFVVVRYVELKYKTFPHDELKYSFVSKISDGKAISVC